MDYLDAKLKPRLNVLQPDQLEDVYSAALEVLEHTGIKITHPGALELLDGCGARVDGNRVHIPDWLIKEALRKAPSRVVLGTRNGERSLQLERNRTYFGSSLDCLDYLEPFTSERREFRLEDCRTLAKMLNAMGNYSWGMTFGCAKDVPPDLADRMVLKAAMTHCEKPMVFCCKDFNSLKDIYEMAILISGGEKNFFKAPTLALLTDPISPLVLSDDTVEIGRAHV